MSRTSVAGHTVAPKLTLDEFWQWMQDRGPHSGKALQCVFCESLAYPEDLMPGDSAPEVTTWQQWQCGPCSLWNDHKEKR